MAIASGTRCTVLEISGEGDSGESGVGALADAAGRKTFPASTAHPLRQLPSATPTGPRPLWRASGRCIATCRLLQRCGEGQGPCRGCLVDLFFGRNAGTATVRVPSPEGTPRIRRPTACPRSDSRPSGGPLTMRGAYVLALEEGLGRLIRRTLPSAAIPPVEPSRPGGRREGKTPGRPGPGRYPPRCVGHLRAAADAALGESGVPGSPPALS